MPNEQGYVKYIEGRDWSEGQVRLREGLTQVDGTSQRNNVTKKREKHIYKCLQNKKFINNQNIRIFEKVYYQSSIFIYVYFEKIL